jgi:tetratricopeptide (TPR) repeat protein
MLVLLTCPQGHRWEMPEEDMPSAATARLACPVCGAAYVRLERATRPEETPTVDAGDLAPVPDLPRIPGYEVLCCLGRGGMGVVYKARHLRLNRLVALKMILSRAHVSPERLARFHLEAEALASLQHPNIVQIHEVGGHDGCPYLALELVDGPSLDKQLAGGPLPPLAAARLVQTLAEAMHHAHQRGLVHRDLKPANVLLSFSGRSETGAGPDTAPLSERPLNECVPKITDFGIAKRLEEDSRTRTGAILGTPSYMAPEQAEGRVRDIGPPTDVYALGAILYELLTGQPPFGGDTLLQTLELVRAQEPKPPSRLRPKVPHDLETICLKCLQKEPGRRYPTAQALAEDLRRFLAGEPIAARPVGTAERVVKWARRRPVVAGLSAFSAAALGVIAALLVGSNVLLRQAAARERQERERAERHSQVVRQAVDEMYTEVAEQWLANEPHKDELQRTFLEKARDIYQKLEEEQGDNPTVRAGAARAYYRVGRIYQDLEERDRAEEAYERALALQEHLVAEHPREASYRQDLAESYNYLGELRRTGGRPLAETEPLYRKALELQRRLRTDFPGDPRCQADQARTWYNLGLAHMDHGRRDEAEQDYGRAIDLLEGLPERFPREPRYRQELARSRADRAILYRKLDRPKAAEADIRRAIDLLEFLRNGPQFRPVYRYELAIYYENLGNLLSQEKRPDPAGEAYDKALALLSRLVEDFPTRPEYQNEQANTHNGLGAVLTRDDQKAEQWEQARKLFARLVDGYPKQAVYRYRLGLVLGNLGWLRLRQGDLPQARRLLEEGSGYVEAVVASNPDDADRVKKLRSQCRDLAEVLIRQGEHAEAARRATALCHAVPGPNGTLLALAFLARCVASAPQAPGLSPTEQDALAQRYADQAVDLLRPALRAGQADPERLRRDPGLEPLRKHAAYRQLLAEARPGPGGPPKAPGR